MIAEKLTKLAACILLPFSLVSGAGAATMQVTIVIDELSSLYTSTTANVGTASYDESKLINVGMETLRGPDAGFSLQFDSFGYVPADDIDPNFPEYYFTDGVLVGFGFEAPLKSANASAGSFLQIEDANVYYSFDGSDQYQAHLVFTSVPEPSAAFFCAISGMMLITRRRRNISRRLL